MSQKKEAVTFQRAHKYGSTVPYVPLHRIKEGINNKGNVNVLKCSDDLKGKKILLDIKSFTELNPF